MRPRPTRRRWRRPRPRRQDRRRRARRRRQDAADSTDVRHGEPRRAVTPSLYVVFDGDVYVLQGRRRRRRPSKLRVAGETRMTFDANTRPTLRIGVHGQRSRRHLHRRTTRSELQRFALVERDVRGRRPTRCRAPTSPSTAAGRRCRRESRGPSPRTTRTARPCSRSTARTPPGTPGLPPRRRRHARSASRSRRAPPADDPAAGNPNWTWWAP